MAVVVGNQNAVLKDLTIIFERAIGAQKRMLHPLICSKVAEAGAYTRMPVAANMALPRKFEGGRAINGKDVPVIETFVQDTYELTIELSSDLLENATAYDFSMLVEEAGMSALQFPSYLCSKMVSGGTGANAYDGNPFYGSTHQYAKVNGAPNINNTVAATGTDVVSLGNDLQSAFALMGTFQDNAGRLLNEQVEQNAANFVIQAPQAIFGNFRKVLNASWVPTTTPVVTSGSSATPIGTNVNEGVASLYPDGYLDPVSASAWYLHCVGMPNKPFVWIENYPIRVKVLGFGSEYQILNNKCAICISNRFVLGYHRFDRSIRVA